jgi:hypothetical protein
MQCAPYFLEGLATRKQEIRNSGNQVDKYAQSNKLERPLSNLY